MHIWAYCVYICDTLKYINNTAIGVITIWVVVAVVVSRGKGNKTYYSPFSHQTLLGYFFFYGISIFTTKMWGLYYYCFYITNEDRAIQSLGNFFEVTWLDCQQVFWNSKPLCFLKTILHPGIPARQFEYLSWSSPDIQRIYPPVRVKMFPDQHCFTWQWLYHSSVYVTRLWLSAFMGKAYNWILSTRSYSLSCLVNRSLTETV